MKIKNYINFLNEADELATPAAPPAQTPPAQATPPVQPSQPAQSGTTETPTQSSPPQGEQKSGDLSNYNNESVTKNPETVKKMVDLIKDMDKSQLIKLRDFIGELKDMEDPKNEIGKI